MTALPPYVPTDLIQARLLQIFPEGSPARGYCTRETAVRAVFTMLYIGAIDGQDRYLAPKQIYKMSGEQALLASEPERLDYADKSWRPKFVSRGSSWYADNSREPIRDETLRQGLIPVGAVRERANVPTSSPRPRYMLTTDFAALFNPALVGTALDGAIATWQAANLTGPALARIALIRSGAIANTEGVEVEFPNHETRRLCAGESSIIAKAVIEEFARRFLTQPAVLWLSESAHKVVARDDLLAQRIGLKIDAAKNLPDIILVDVGHADGAILVFVEVVATDGPISDTRRAELLKVAQAANFPERHVAFVTAYLDRERPAARKTFPILAPNSFAWSASEPATIISIFGGTEEQPLLLHSLLRLSQPR